MKTLEIAILFIVLQTTACQKEAANSLSKLSKSSITNFKSEINYKNGDSYELYFDDVHGGIQFKANKSYYDQTNSTWLCNAYFHKNLWGSYTLSNRVYEDVGNVKIDALSILKEPSNAYGFRDFTDANKYLLNGLLGKIITCKVDGSATSGYLAQTTTLYIPKPLNIKFTSDTSRLNNRPVLKRNSFLNLKWDAEPGNSKGVLLIIESSGKVTLNGVDDMNNSRDYTKNVLLLEDDGNYTFTPSDFDNISNNSELLFIVIRGNIKIINNNNRKVKVYGGEEIFANQYILMP